MKNSVNTVIKLKLIFIITAIISVSSFAVNLNDYIDFLPPGYNITQREISEGGTILETEIDKEIPHLFIKLDKNNENYEIHMLRYKNATKLMEFWYDFVNFYGSGFESAVSAIPYIYGRFNTVYDYKVINSWFNTNEMIISVVTGTEKSGVDDLKFKLNKYR